MKIKSTGFALMPSLETLAAQKILKPLEKRVGQELPVDTVVDVEFAKTTRHHLEGKIWKCEVNFPMPGERRTIYVEALAESLEAAIDGAKDELERQISAQKGKRFSKFLRAARSVKEEFHITCKSRRRREKDSQSFCGPRGASRRNST
ncbi:MAG: hypothetical protein UY61_C0087G0004 [Candidatus Adlerbacteria bacterium GW2011_GWC1_50_9]|uniref:Ribosomal subunit interface protein n=1 Tax=Candidatus Adlerbacteria bacterium GW2011_GWC1_50_9 TaxID=1618608 RepID=A0A0G1WHM0_9BACT|nr:MAG: hypothetical protein UY61_C0087G0004 [Candidatus Adlerbacteria bacterium GW2011_GWC1_50_9]